MDLETKRNAMLVNAVQSGKIVNMLANKTWLPQYFSADGSLIGNTQTKHEEEYIDVDTTKTYFIMMFKDSGTCWWSIAEYDANEVFQNRQATVSSGKSYGIFVTFSNPKIRFSFQYYTTGLNLFMCEESELLNVSNFEEI